MTSIKLLLAALALPPLIAGAPAVADTAHEAACAAALAEAQSVRDGFGLWRGEDRRLSSQRAKMQARPDNATAWKEDNEKHRREWGPLSDRFMASSKNQFTLHQSGACAEDAQITEALTLAAKYKDMPDVATARPLPEGFCPSSPDLDAPLAPCQKKP